MTADAYPDISELDLTDIAVPGVAPRRHRGLDGEAGGWTLHRSDPPPAKPMSPLIAVRLRSAGIAPCAAENLGEATNDNASEPRDRASIEPDDAAIREHIARIHDCAKGLDGVIPIAAYGEMPSGEKLAPLVRRFRVGDVEAAAAAAAEMARRPFYNVYMPLAVFRPDLPDGRKGGEDDVIGTLGLVADFDDDQARSYRERLPLPPDYVLETSEGRYQTVYLLDSPLPSAEAKSLAEALVAFASSDKCSKDLSHVWRIPGTFNRPTAKKIANGRPLGAQLVRLREGLGATDVTSVAALRLALRDALEAQGKEPPRGSEKNIEQFSGPTNIPLLMSRLPPKLREKIESPTPSGQRSEAAFHVIGSLHELGLSQLDCESVILAHPVGIGERYFESPDPAASVRREITRCYQKTDGGTRTDALADHEGPNGKRVGLLRRSHLDGLKPPTYLIDQILALGAVSCLAGAPGTGKTFLALDMALSAATGRPFFEFATRQGRVLYVASEGQSGIRGRIRAWETVRLGGQLITDDNPLWLLGSIHLDKPASLDSLIKLIEQEGIGSLDLIVIDTLAANMSGPESDDVAMKVMIEGSRRLARRFGCHVCLVHHPPKDITEKAGSQLFRGHGSLFGDIDVAMFLTAKDGVIQLRQEKNKEDEVIKPLTLRLVVHDLSAELGNSTGGRPITSCTLELVADAPSSGARRRGKKPSRTNRASEAVILALLSQGPASHGDLVSAVQASGIERPKAKNLVNRILARLIKDTGVVRKTDEGVYELLLIDPGSN